MDLDILDFLRSLLPWNGTRSLKCWMVLLFKGLGVAMTLIRYSERSAIQAYITEHMFSMGFGGGKNLPSLAIWFYK